MAEKKVKPSPEEVQEPPKTILYSGQDITPLVVDYNEKKGEATVVIMYQDPDGKWAELINKRPSTPTRATAVLRGHIKIQ